MPAMEFPEMLPQQIGTLLPTKPQRARIPPGYRIATGHDDHVMLMLSRVVHVENSVSILMEVIRLAEYQTIVDGLTQAPGFISKKIPIDDAERLKEKF